MKKKKSTKTKAKAILSSKKSVRLGASRSTRADIARSLKRLRAGKTAHPMGNPASAPPNSAMGKAQARQMRLNWSGKKSSKRITAKFKKDPSRVAKFNSLNRASNKQMLEGSGSAKGRLSILKGKSTLSQKKRAVMAARSNPKLKGNLSYRTLQLNNRYNTRISQPVKRGSAIFKKGVQVGHPQGQLIRGKRGGFYRLVNGQKVYQPKNGSGKMKKKGKR